MEFEIFRIPAAVNITAGLLLDITVFVLFCCYVLEFAHSFILTSTLALCT